MHRSRKHFDGQQEKRKRFDGEQEKSMAASIERLPDDILVRILSFTSTKCCVRSSILGKKWRFLWASVPNLKFDSWEHKTLKSLMNFFNRFVFLQKGHTINTFSIEYDAKKDSEYKFEIETLVATAIACNPQVFNFYSDFELVLPQCIFTCKTLVDLELCELTLLDLMLIRFCENNIPMTSTTVYLPALKKLSLVRIRYETEDSLVHLLSGCPALEELYILKEDTNVVCFNVSSTTLNRLELRIPKENVDDKAFEVKLDTPALEYLELHDFLSRDFSAGMLASLTEADVVFGAQMESEWDVLYSRSVLEFVGKINNVSCLKLTTGLMEVPDLAFSALTTKFRNLTELRLTGDWRFVTTFLENSDNLEVLSIYMDDKPEYWMEPKQVPVCLKKNLRKLTFFNFKCSEPEFDMVEYILRNAKVLKLMDIVYFSDSHRHLKKKYGALRRISLFERASEACRLAFD